MTFVLFFLMFTAFTVAAYGYSNHLLLDRERDNINKTVDGVREHLDNTDSNLTLTAIKELIDQSPDIARMDSRSATYLVSRHKFLVSLIYVNQELAVYDKHKRLLVVTSDEMSNYNPETLNKIQSFRLNGLDGYILTEKVYSDKTGELIGYVTLFHDLTFYKKMRNGQLALLIVTELIGTVLSLVLISFLTRRFLSPVRNLHRVMRNIADNPSDLHVRSRIQSGDEIEELSQIFDNMLDRVEDYTQRQTQFISDVSHELRTPVAVIKGHIQMLQRWGKDDPEILDESLEAAAHEADRMTIMINDMLDMVRVQGSFDQHRDEQSNVRKVMEMVLQNFRVLRDDFVFSFENSLTEDVPVAIYGNHLEQALTILVDNAVKYSPVNKRICLTLRDVDSDYVEVTVRDHGEGISEDEMKYIFERFYRTDKSRNRASTQAGLGIGLSILKQIVEAYHLKMSVCSEVNEGTTFTILIPKAK